MALIIIGYEENFLKWPGLGLRKFNYKNYKIVPNTKNIKNILVLINQLFYKSLCVKHIIKIEDQDKILII